MNTALVTGVAGQDGILLARLLLSEGVRVVGTVADSRQAASVIREYLQGVDIREVDITDRAGLRTVLQTDRPDEIYNLAAWSSVGSSWSDPIKVANTNGVAVVGLLEEVLSLRRAFGYAPRVLQASSSEMFGLASRWPQNEGTRHHPRSPYGTAKSFAHHSAINYRESYSLPVSTAILFNHESPLRQRSFVTRRITSQVAEIALGMRDTLSLMRIDISRDWGSALDYVDAMRMVIRNPTADDFCIATGVSHTLYQFVVTALSAIGISDASSRIILDESQNRPADVPSTLGDPAKAIRVLGWQPRMSFEQVVNWMVWADLKRLESGREHDVDLLVPPGGFA